MTTTTTHAESEAWAQLASIREMVAALDTEDEEALDAAMQAIQEDPLSVEVRSGWHLPGARGCSLAEYCILLSTGGPGCRILGDLQYDEPVTAKLQYQDWDTPWTELITTGEDHEAVLRYTQQFYYGEGS